MEKSNKRGRKPKTIDYNNVFAVRLRELIEENGVTQKQISENISASRQALNKWVNGETIPDILAAAELADYFGVSLDYLTGRGKTRSSDEDIDTIDNDTGLCEEVDNKNVFADRYEQYFLEFQKYMQRRWFEMFNAPTIGKRIKDLRGKTPQEQCAKDLGISRGALSFYENGERKPDAEILVRMCAYFKVSADYLLGLSDVESVDPDMQAACELTGLSEKTVNKLADLNNSNKSMSISKIVSRLVEDDEFFSLVSRLYSVVNSSDHT